MKLAIVGSRSFGDRVDDGKVRRAVFAYVATLPKDTVIVSGGASGVDTWAEAAAKQYGLATIIYKPDWKTFGNSAGFIRNQKIVTEADAVVAWWNGYSKGTQHSIGLARAQGKSVVINPEAG